MFSEELQAWLKKNNSTLHDAIRVLRPDGPLDSITFSTACMSCSGQVTEKLRWFHEHEMRCACGGTFQTRDLDRFMAFAQAGEVGAARSIPTIKFSNPLE